MTTETNLYEMMWHEHYQQLFDYHGYPDVQADIMRQLLEERQAAAAAPLGQLATAVA